MVFVSILEYFHVERKVNIFRYETFYYGERAVMKENR